MIPKSFCSSVLKILFVACTMAYAAYTPAQVVWSDSDNPSKKQSDAWTDSGDTGDSGGYDNDGGYGYDDSGYGYDGGSDGYGGYRGMNLVVRDASASDQSLAPEGEGGGQFLKSLILL